MNTYPAELYTSGYTAAALAYHELKRLVLEGDVPLGLRLREERIADRLGVSRTPVREALLRLHAEHFLERHPEGGFRVLNPSVQTMRELYDVRRALELFAMRSFAFETTGPKRRDMAAVEELRDEWSALAPGDAPLDPEFVLLDEDFHARLAESGGNHQLAVHLRQVNERIRPVRAHDFVTPGRTARTIEQHLAILEAVLGCEPEAAAALLDAHIQQSQGVVETAVGRMLERMLSIEQRDSSW